MMSAVVVFMTRMLFQQHTDRFVFLFVPIQLRRGWKSIHHVSSVYSYCKALRFLSPLPLP